MLSRAQLDHLWEVIELECSFQTQWPLSVWLPQTSTTLTLLALGPLLQKRCPNVRHVPVEMLRGPYGLRWNFLVRPEYRVAGGCVLVGFGDGE